jgi:pimeloyl-ACP methyl ester carboxylesterase
MLSVLYISGVTMSIFQASLRTCAALAIIAAPAFAAAATPAPASLAGHWVGIYQVDGKLPWFVKVNIAPDGAGLKGTVDIPSHNQLGIPLKDVTAKGFVLPSPDGEIRFDGDVRKDNVVGKVALGGAAGKFTLQRALPQSMDHDRQIAGAYRFPGDRVVVFSSWGDFPQMFYTDMKTGRHASVFATTPERWFAGTANFNVSEKEVEMQFKKDAQGVIQKLEWKQKGEAPRTGQRMHFRTEEVSFNNGDVKLSGTVVLPEGKGPFPAVVLTQMSSPAPREAYALQAYYFAANGIAALMYDKRGVGKSGGEFNRSTMETLADDAIAGLELLAKRSDIQADRIGTWGHSQGGWLAPLAAARSGRVAFVIAQAASAVPPAEQEVFRIQQALTAARFSPEEIKAGTAYQQMLMDWVLGGGANHAELLASARANEKAPWAHEVEIVPDTFPKKPRETSTKFYGYDPLPDLAKLKAPVVYILGDKDSFVPTHKSAKLFNDTLAKLGHKDYQVWMLPNAAHGLWETEVDGGGAFINSRYWAKEHYPRMTKWLRDRGFARKAQ